MSSNKLNLKEGYRITRCCSPQPNDSTIGYFSYNNVIVVHKASCSNFKKIEPKQAFERHRRLKSLKLLKRVEKVMIQYRKDIVENKWIKHRNHTYYQITPKGERYLDFFVSQRIKRW